MGPRPDTTRKGRDDDAFLTWEPNPLVAPIHEKVMPLILHSKDYDRWLDDETASAWELTQSFASQLMARA